MIDIDVVVVPVTTVSSAIARRLMFVRIRVVQGWTVVAADILAAEKEGLGYTVGKIQVVYAQILYSIL